MCRSAECSVCHGKTWIGCGQHIPTAMEAYPKSEWCKCESASGSIPLEGYPPKFGDAK